MIYKALNTLFLNIWYNENILFKLISFILIPISIAYLILFNIRNFFRKTYSFNTPIICIGNIVAGGSGKTSIALALIKMLPEKKIIVLLKGYKGRLNGTIRVDQNKYTAIATGDEALLYAKVVTTYICSNRKDAIDIIIKDDNPDLIIMDDGLQDSSIIKSKNIVAINGRRGFGNNLLLPSGPLRQTVSSIINDNHIFIINGEDKKKIRSKYKNHFFETKIYSGIKGNNKSIVAFSGIADNESFFQTLEKHKFNLSKKITFPDHFYYKNHDIENIIKDANELGLEIYTTSKDWVRLKENHKKIVKQLLIDIEIQDKDKLINLIIN